MSWTTPAELRAQVQKLWDKGDLLRLCVQESVMPPRRLRMTGPTSSDLTERFDAVRVWMADLGCNTAALSAPRYRIVMREFRHRVLGVNAVPDEIWIDTLDDALGLIGKQKEYKRFDGLLQLTRTQHPLLLPWLEKRPLGALALAEVWPHLLSVVSWLQLNPRSGIYLRQVDLAGVDSKFIEANRGVLSELLDLALPLDSIDISASGASQFCQRYGFKDKPLRIRFRLLDSRVALLPEVCEQDVGVTQTAFERLDLPVQRVFITENEVNFLAFPPLEDSMVIFGAGYGFEVLTGARWLHERCIYYWGDIDTHGFAILDQLRARLPDVQSLLMDRATLLAHESQWVEEAQPVVRDLPRLHIAETALFDDLRCKRLGDARKNCGVRLEQERIGFGWMQQALAALPESITRTTI
ncbi:Wadjet anti-phage system protein JetD domain-containing protein [Janthinobacterium sp.]|uniref:Wadjet anti-phage system protein JetD domain-containing protein n=1 Tax=Janthinobacterium sp. TaxID=1871054 RepID=UPI00293D3EF2|nr:Wadjet anti-phage system protein JetD domain-containing protein [Janthinobacterium sp.]